jgi:pimeloyl-ACP methyl ester carboxylesterase
MPNAICDVPGARLHWKSRGSGPVLFVLQGGDGDADASVLLADRLASAFTVLTYDRRGLSRSEIDGPVSLELSTHTNDAAAVLEAATAEPAFVFGTSIGALMGLDLVARFPSRVRKLIAHEPPSTELLNPEQFADTERTRDEIDALYKAKGVLPAMRRFFAGTGIDFMDREPDVGFPPANPSRMANLKFFLEHDVPAARRLQALRPVREKLVIGAGSSSKGLWIHGCAGALAARLGLPLEDFPGGHGGYAAHPRGFAEKLTQLCR